MQRRRSEEVSEYVGYWLCDNGDIVERETGTILPVYSSGTIRLAKEGGKKDTPVAHRLIALAFVAQPNGANFVRFKDGDSSNRAAKNLEWVIGVRKVSQKSKEIVGLWLLGEKTTSIAKLMECTPQYVTRVLKDHKKRIALGNPDQA